MDRKVYKPKFTYLLRNMKHIWKCVAISVVGLIIFTLTILLIHSNNRAETAFENCMFNNFQMQGHCEEKLSDVNNAYNESLDMIIKLLLQHQAATDFLVKNQGKLHLPSCYKNLTYITTESPDVLYLMDGNYLGWYPGSMDLYCWNGTYGVFDCENFCKV